MNGKARPEIVRQRIFNHAAEKGVKVTFVRILKFWDGIWPTYTLRINVMAHHYEQAMQDGFWPEDFLVRPWKSQFELDREAEERDSYY